MAPASTVPDHPDGRALLHPVPNRIVRPCVYVATFDFGSVLYCVYTWQTLPRTANDSVVPPMVLRYL